MTIHTHVTSLAFAIVAVIALGCGGATVSGPASSSQGGGSVSDFTLKDIDGESVSLYQHTADNVVVISFWAPCCESSRQIMADSQTLHEKFQVQGVVFLGIAVDEPDTRNQVRSFIKQRAISFPILLDAESVVMGRLNTRRVLPYTLVLRKGGELSWTHEGYVPGDSTLIEAAVGDALKAI